ncbi:hypothetical protein FHS43_000949 [Streptosporangium becharense]|uniref:Uncharacterized protein n=1 Tax=Streptosporangium becharense TaxID=1816182 RepID=A0A7W9MGA3_9ACTN|nr:hypothetical protein [Streptosporangium becharense]MBB2909703.1 hypothetical protein [Streptosporangium becharense]MBB5819341.1 hypothetical protein [Streptosporangium becharense]
MGVVVIKVEASRLREPAAWLMVAAASASVLVGVERLLFGGSSFAVRAVLYLDQFTSPVVAALLVGAVLLATHLGPVIERLRLMALVAAGTLGLSLLFGLVGLVGGLFGGAAGFLGKIELLLLHLPGLALAAIALLYLLPRAVPAGESRAADGFGRFENQDRHTGPGAFEHDRNQPQDRGFGGQPHPQGQDFAGQDPSRDRAARGQSAQDAPHGPRNLPALPPAPEHAQGSHGDSEGQPRQTGAPSAGDVRPQTPSHVSAADPQPYGVQTGSYAPAPQHGSPQQGSPQLGSQQNSSQPQWQPAPQAQPMAPVPAPVPAEPYTPNPYVAADVQPPTPTAYNSPAHGAPAERAELRLPGYGQAEPQVPGYGQTEPRLPDYGQLSDFGHGGYGQSEGQPSYGRGPESQASAYGQPGQSGPQAPAYGQSGQSGQPESYGQPPEQAPGYGQFESQAQAPAYGQSVHGAPAEQRGEQLPGYGQPGTHDSGYGQHSNPSLPGYGQYSDAAPTGQQADSPVSASGGRHADGQQSYNHGLESQAPVYGQSESQAQAPAYGQSGYGAPAEQRGDQSSDYGQTEPRLPGYGQAEPQVPGYGQTEPRLPDYGQLSDSGHGGYGQSEGQPSYGRSPGPQASTYGQPGQPESYGQPESQGQSYGQSGQPESYGQPQGQPYGQSPEQAPGYGQSESQAQAPAYGQSGYGVPAEQQASAPLAGTGGHRSTPFDDRPAQPFPQPPENYGQPFTGYSGTEFGRVDEPGPHYPAPDPIDPRTQQMAQAYQQAESYQQQNQGTAPNLRVPDYGSGQQNSSYDVPFGHQQAPDAPFGHPQTSQAQPYQQGGPQWDAQSEATVRFDPDAYRADPLGAAAPSAASWDSQPIDPTAIYKPEQLPGQVTDGETPDRERTGPGQDQNMSWYGSDRQER